MATSLSLLGLTSLLLIWEISLAPSLVPFPFDTTGFSPPFHEGMSHETPVKLLTLKPLRSQRRHGLPERSRALRLALMAPALVLGLSLWAPPPPVGRLFVVAVVWSIVPSSLLHVSIMARFGRALSFTYFLGFFLGPGLPRGLESPFV